jgi:DNA-binding protein YbaB
MTAGLSDEGGIREPRGATEHRTAVDAQAVSDRLGRLRVTAEDGHRIAEVTIDSTGALVDIRFSERIQHAQPEVVSRAVMNAVREARSNIAEVARQLVLDIVGGESAAADAIVERMVERLRAPEPGGAGQGPF